MTIPCDPDSMPAKMSENQEEGYSLPSNPEILKVLPSPTTLILGDGIIQSHVY
jgi:hypothetical protein